MSNLTRTCLGLFVATFFLSITPNAKAQETLTIAASNWAPYKDENLPGGGIVMDVTTQALIRAGYKVDSIVLPWKRTLQGAIIGKYDVLPAIWHTAERAEKLVFSEPIITSRVVIISKKSINFEYKTLESLTGRTVGVGIGWGYPEDFQKATNFTRDTSHELKITLNKLIFGRVNLAIVEEYAARYAMNAYFKDDADNVTYSKVSLEEKDLRVAFSKKHSKHEEILKRFNVALAEMKTDGTFQKIMSFHGVSLANR